MTIRVIELFAGIGAQAAALERLGLDHECIAVAEIDERAYRGYCAIHGDVPNLGDVTKIEHLPECDLLTYSFPCLGAGTLIQTEDGWKPVENVQAGDRVWTDDGWRKVTKSMMTGIKRTYRIKPSFGLEIRATGNHPFLVRRMYRKRNAKHSYDRLFREPEWVAAEDLTKNMYLGYPIPEEGPIPDYEGYQETRSDGRVYTYDSLKEHMGNPRFWWTVGRYIADGYVYGNGCVAICIGKGKEKDIENIPFHYSASKFPSCTKIIIAKQELGRFLTVFGKGAPNKHIPPKYRNLPIPLAKAMLEGYLSGDGHYSEKIGHWTAGTVSPALALDIAQLVAYVHHRPSGISVFHRKPECVIEGRTVNQRDSINVKFHEEPRIQDKSFYEDGWIWTRILDIRDPGESEPVYDLEVEDRHCFTANNVIVHNCTDISMAGKREGMEEGSGTRSSLLWEVGRFLDDYKERGCLPEVLLMENVDAILFKANMPGFQRWMDRLADMGYTNSYQVLNAKDYGVPQNRKRCFLVFTLTKGALVFPAPIPLKIRMKDLLEKDVPESFYLSEERIATFERHKKRQEENGRGFGYKPRDPNGDSERERERVSSSILTNADRYECTWLDETPKSEGRGEPGPDTDGKVIRTGDLNNGSAQNGAVYDPDGVSPALMASAGEKGNHVRIDVSDEAKVEVVGDLNNPHRLDQHNRVYGADGVSPTLFTPHGCDATPKIEEPGIEISGLLKGNSYEQGQRVYNPEGCAPTLAARDYKEAVKISEETPDPGQDGSGTIVEGSLNMPGRYESALRVYVTEGTAPTLPTGGGGGIMPKILEEPRGGGDPMIECVGHLRKLTQHYRVYSADGVSPTLGACDGKDPTKIISRDGE